MIEKLFTQIQEKIGLKPYSVQSDKHYQQIIESIEKLERKYSLQPDQAVQAAAVQLKEEVLLKGIENIIIPGYALVKTAIRRVLKLNPFPVQLAGAIAMHQGKLVEMQTGEGKTLTAVFPAYLNALSAEGVHILTFNDYLARRDAQWMGPVFKFLGLTVGFIQDKMSIRERQEAYNSDITYLTAKEAGFDYLRDNLRYKKEDLVQRPFHFAIVDEADSILVDTARVPLIIAGSSDEYIEMSRQVSHIAGTFKENEDFEFDEYRRNFYLTEQGLEKAENRLACGPLHNSENLPLLTRLNCAIHAHHLFKRDVDYIIRNNKAELVDELTGRIADKRRWPDGLQAAVEIKENLPIQATGRILNSITLQHFIRLYPKLSGMTATASESAKEFLEFFNLSLVKIPPNTPSIRKDMDDILHKTKASKEAALIAEITEVHKSGRPILVGTRSVEESDNLVEKLQRQGVACQVLNAKNDTLEAEIIANAGQLYAVTISTNMAGRGTDIRLGKEANEEREQIIKLGGLYVLATNKHESRRIDKQLIGRAGRQGDPGSSRFFISYEDDLFVKFNLKDLLPYKFQFTAEDGPIDDPVLKREITRLQRIIENQNLEIRKNNYQYAALLEKQRQIVLDMRKAFLSGRAAVDLFEEKAKSQADHIRRKLGQEPYIEISRTITLFIIDKYWADHLARVNDIREGIHLKRLGGQNPLFEFQKQLISLFDLLLDDINSDRIRTFNRLKIKDGRLNLEESGIKAPSSTWTYLINDNPFEDLLGIKLMGNMSMQIGGGIFGPLVALYPLLKRIAKRQKTDPKIEPM